MPSLNKKGARHPLPSRVEYVKLSIKKTLDRNDYNSEVQKRQRNTPTEYHNNNHNNRQSSNIHRR